MGEKIPVVDLGVGIERAASEIGRACEAFGFFCIKQHGVKLETIRRLEELSRDFFALPESEKMKISMKLGGKAWRGYFPVGDELTSGRADLKEGLYFGTELGPSDPRVQRRLPLHGANLFPELPGFREAVLDYMRELTELGHRLMSAISLSLGLDAGYFREHFSKDPTLLFRIFHYPASHTQSEDKFPWGVGEHTDYGILTILLQDDCGGLEVKTKNSWLEIPPMPNTFVCNVGDMLDFLSGGKYVSAPHRVKNRSGRSRYSLPFFFDPDFQAKMEPLPLATGEKRAAPARWDNVDLHQYRGTYGEYLGRKVSKVFPELARRASGKD